MKIGFFTSIEGWGGSEMYLLRLMRGVRANGHEAVLFGVGGSQLYDRAQKDGIHTIRWRSMVGSEGNKQRLSDNTSSYQSLRSQLKQLILKGAPKGILLIAGNLREAIRLMRLFNASPIDCLHINVHGYEMAGVAAHLAGLPCVGVYCTSPDRERGVRRIFVWLTGKFYTKIISKSHFCTNAWAKVLGRRLADCICVWNGVDAQFFHCSKRTRGQEFRVVSAGRLHTMKSFNILIAAMYHLQDLPIKLHIAGSGPEEKTLRTLIQTTGLDRAVHLDGHVEDMQSFLSEADIFCLTSSRFESFGQVLIEAMSMGIPLITNDYGPFPEINVDGETGFVVSSPDVKQIADRIRFLFEHPDVCLQMGLAARTRAETYFSLDRMVKDTFSVYESCLS